MDISMSWPFLTVFTLSAMGFGFTGVFSSTLFSLVACFSKGLTGAFSGSAD
jgi:hypothetical protein